MADLTLTIIAERLGCKPDALAICVAIERMKQKLAKAKKKRK